MKYRLYYWILGAPENRPGGAWWYRDFDNDYRRQQFFKHIKPLLHDYRFIEGEKLPKHHLNDICPPEES